MSYRSFKHLLGETSLERKCRFIFGFGILVLVTGSFFYYGLKTETLVKQQTTQTARMLVNPTLKDIHYKTLGNYLFEEVFDVLWEDLKPIGDLPEYRFDVLNPYSTKKSKKQPADSFEAKALDRFLQAASKSATADPSTSAAVARERANLFADGSKTWEHREVSTGNGEKDYQYIQAVVFKPTCLMDCHSNRPRTRPCG